MIAQQHLTDDRVEERVWKEHTTEYSPSKMKPEGGRGGTAVSRWGWQSKGKKCKVCWQRKKASRVRFWKKWTRVRGRNSGRKLKQTCSTIAGSYALLFFSPRLWLRYLCSAFPHWDVFLAFAEVREVVSPPSVASFLLILTCLLLFIPLFPISACPYLTCGLQFSRDITALVRREIILTFLVIHISCNTTFRALQTYFPLCSVAYYY